MTQGIRKDGEFCWINVLTPEPAAARAFFAELLGWTYGEMPGLGHTILVGGRPVGGLFDLAAPQTPPGTPPCIGVMVQVASADAHAARARELGGRALAPFDVGPAGRMAVCFDPAGANFDLWQAKGQAGTDVDPALHGAPSWFECRTPDLERAAAFYAALFGWRAVPVEGHAIRYTTFQLGGLSVAGALQLTPAMGQPAPRWATYFTVDDAGAAASRAAALGARTTLALRDAPGGVRFAGFESPQGVPFHVVQRAG